MERLANFPDLNEAFTTGLLEMHADGRRGDGPEPHVSDLGKCDLAVWARRNGREMIEHGPLTAARMDVGLELEGWVIERIERGLPAGEGWLIERSRVIEGEDGMTGHLDAILARATHPARKGWAIEIDDNVVWFKDQPNAYLSECTVERAYFDVKTTAFQMKWQETGEFWEDTGKPIKRKVYVPYDDFPGSSYHFQSGGYCKRTPVNPDGKHMPYAIAALDKTSNAFVAFGWYDSDNEGFTAAHDLETKRKLELTAPGVDPVAAGIATVRSDGMIAGIPPEDSMRGTGKSWMCGYCDFIECALNTNPDAEAL